MTETAADIAAEQAARRERLRAAAAEQRTALADRLRREDADDLAAKLDGCGLPASLTCTNCGGIHSIETRCRRRWCPSCARSLAAERAARYHRRLQTLQWPLWVTLTMTNTDDAEMIPRLKAAFKTFRRRKIWKAHTVGGLWALEVTERGNGYHPHIHAMLDCKWLAADTPPPHPLDTRATVGAKIDAAKCELSAEWGAAVGQDWAVALAVRKSGADAVRELLKYTVKGSDLLSSLLPVAPLIRQIDSGRTISTFGTLRNGKLPPEPDDDRPALGCKECGAEKSWLPSELAMRYFGGNADSGRTYFPSSESNPFG